MTQKISINGDRDFFFFCGKIYLNDFSNIICPKLISEKLTPKKQTDKHIGDTEKMKMQDHISILCIVDHFMILEF